MNVKILLLATLTYKLIITLPLTMISKYSSNTAFIGLNPALQRTITVPNFKIGEVNRGSKVRIGIGGKGQNAIVAASCMNIQIMPHVIQFLGKGYDGDSLLSMIEKMNVETVSIRTEAPCRVCVTLIDNEDTTEVIEPSQPLLTNEINDLLNLITQQYFVNKLSAVAIMGSVPYNCPINIYSSIVSTACDHQTKIVLDTITNLIETTKTCLQKKSSVTIKVNTKELFSIGQPDSVILPNQSDPNRDLEYSRLVVTASSKLLQFIIVGLNDILSLLHVAVTDGSNPAHLVKLSLSQSQPAIQHWLLHVPNLTRSLVSPIGAGDATSSGLLLCWSNQVNISGKSNDSNNGNTYNVLDSFRWGLSCGSASCMSDANSIFEKTDAESIFHSIIVTNPLNL
jgi:fructose-1-phosphate kinase PfkB-like protein